MLFRSKPVYARDIMEGKSKRKDKDPNRSDARASATRNTVKDSKGNDVKDGNGNAVKTRNPHTR